METYLKTCEPCNSTATAQRTGARKLSWFCTVGTWKIHEPWRTWGVHVRTGTTRSVPGLQLLHTHWATTKMDLARYYDAQWWWLHLIRSSVASWLGRRRAHTDGLSGSGSVQALRREWQQQKQTDSLGTAEQTNFDRCSMRENKPKTKTVYLGTVEQTNLHLFGGGSNAHVWVFALGDVHTRWSNTEVQCWRGIKIPNFQVNLYTRSTDS